MTSFTHQPRSPSPTNTKASRIPLVERSEWRKQQTLVRQNAVPNNTPKIWKGMHHPEWRSAHPEENELISSGEYWWHAQSGMKSIIERMSEGDEFVIEVMTAIGKTKPHLKTAAKKGYLRKGIITVCPVIQPQQFDLDKEWYVIKIDWDKTQYPLNKAYKNSGQRAICEQNQ